MGRDRNAGSQKKRPQFANCTADPSAMMSSVRRISVGPKMTANGLGPPVFCRLAGPGLRLVDVASNPQREERRDDAHDEEPSPGVGAK